MVGKGGAVQASAFYNTLSAYPALKAQTETIVYVGERRWDIVLKDGVRIMLPETKLMDALKRLEDYNREHGILNLNVERIDMRVEGQAEHYSSSQRRAPELNMAFLNGRGACWKSRNIRRS